MKTLIIVESKHCGSTRKVAEAMAAALPGTIVTDTKGAKSYDLHDFDLVGFGSGIYAGGFDKRIVKLVNSLDDESANTFVFSTSGGDDTHYNQLLITSLEAKNKTVAGDFSCLGLNKFFLLRLIGGLNKDCPTEKDLKEAGDFLCRIAK
ncbi:MAG TPA: flavodoxin domain-containing protein [Bacillota bacterium]|nr:flavodoxin domain-containing protein [Bacillota bacterium]